MLKPTQLKMQVGNTSKKDQQRFVLFVFEYPFSFKIRGEIQTLGIIKTSFI